MMFAPNRLLRVLPAALLLGACVYYIKAGGYESLPFHRTPPPPPPPPPAPTATSEPPPPVRWPFQAVADGVCHPDIGRLRADSLELSETILYTRRCVKPVFSSSPGREVVTKLNGPLIDRQATINLTTCAGGQPQADFGACEPIALDVPRPPLGKKYPHLIFGTATSYDRLKDSLPAFTHWLADTDALLLTIVMDAEPEGKDDQPPPPPKDLPAMEKLYKDAGVKLRAIKPHRKGLSVDRAHFTIIEDFLEVADGNTKWLGIIDDDTFFPHLNRMDEELGTHDASKPFWIGALSDDMRAVRNWGIQAFGGAGTFLSVPLARELQPVIDVCMTGARHGSGDATLSWCIFSQTHTRLTITPGMYQHDIGGDVSGFYESGVQPLSLHHWKSWYHEPMVKMAAVAALCGDCFLQRWQFGQDTLLANGYSISTYPKDGGLNGIDLTRTENTFAGDDPSVFDWSLGPMRPKVPDGHKKTYKLRDVFTTEGGEFHQLYVFMGKPEAGVPDEVFELVWKP